MLSETNFNNDFNEFTFFVNQAYDKYHLFRM